MTKPRSIVRFSRDGARPAVVFLLGGRIRSRASVGRRLHRRQIRRRRKGLALSLLVPAGTNATPGLLVAAPHAGHMAGGAQWGDQHHVESGAAPPTARRWRGRGAT